VISGARIGIMGGTFDPIHFGHLVTAEEALVQFNLDRVIFMPTGTPAAKTDQAVSPAEQRYLMTVLATAANPDFEVSRMEVDRPGLTFTVDTLTNMRAEYGPAAEIFFITGADAVWEIVSWRDASRIADLATFIAATRPGYDLDAARRAHEQAATSFSIEYIEVPALAISSTDIRERVAHRRPIRYLAPEPVVAYISKLGLYRDTGQS
jgi:nicotinate-nucleotide adenylyltransferase